MIALLRARFPECFLRLNPANHIVPIGEPAVADRFAQMRHWRGVTQHHRHGGGLFAPRRECGPNIGYRRIVSNLALLDEAVEAQRSRAFGAGINNRNRIALPACCRRSLGGGGGHATVEIDNRLSFQHQTNARANFVPLGKIGAESIEHSGKFRRTETSDGLASGELLGNMSHGLGFLKNEGLIDPSLVHQPP